MRGSASSNAVRSAGFPLVAYGELQDERLVAHARIGVPDPGRWREPGRKAGETLQQHQHVANHEPTPVVQPCRHERGDIKRCVREPIE